jgi:mercuric ion transport protein
MDQSTKLIGTGVTGAFVSILCCFTPVLALLLGVLGLSAYAAKLDYVLIPVFLASIALVLFAVVWKRRNCPRKTGPT